MISAEQIKELRDRTGISIGECKKALEAAGGDLDKAIEALKARGAEIAEKKSSRTLGSGTVSAYIHAGGAVGAMVALLCETDFVAKNPEFKALADDIAMHTAAMMPADPAELLTQPFIKDPSQSIEGLIKSYVQKFGERIEVGEFARFSATARS